MKIEIKEDESSKEDQVNLTNELQENGKNEETNATQINASSLAEDEKTSVHPAISDLSFTRKISKKSKHKQLNTISEETTNQRSVSSIATDMLGIPTLLQHNTSSNVSTRIPFDNDDNLADLFDNELSYNYYRNTIQKIISKLLAS